MRPSPIVPLLLGLAATVAHSQQTARLVKYHTNDIVNVRAKMRYTTLIELPTTEKIMEVATGDKDFWSSTRWATTASCTRRRKAFIPT